MLDRSLDITASEANTLLAQFGFDEPEVECKPVATTQSSFDFETFASNHGIEIASTSTSNGRTKYVLAECVFNSEHRAPDAAVFVEPSGQLGYKCQHNSCSEYHWFDVRNMFEPGYRDRYKQRVQPSGNSTVVTSVNLVESEGRTDAANAKRLIARHGENSRFIKEWNKWACWNETQWEVGSTGIQEQMKETAAFIWHELKEAVEYVNNNAEMEEKDQQSLIGSMTSFARASNNYTALRNAIAVAASDSLIVESHDSFDSHPLLFNAENGTLDLKTGMLHRHDKRHLITQKCRVHYDPKATAERWNRFIDEITLGDSALAIYLQKLVGFSLTGLTDTHVLPVVYGTGANGKSVFFGALFDLLGDDYSAKANVELLLTKRGAHPTELTILHNRRFVACIEADEGRRLHEAQLKEITGGDKIAARRMREDFWQFTPTAKVWLATNHKPKVRGDDNGIWRRLRLVPFDAVIPPERRDRDLSEKLRAELPGILNWAMTGCQRYLAEGLLPEPERVRQATTDYRTENDTIGQYLDECTVDAPAAIVKASVLYDDYVKWAESRREKPMSMRAFGSRLDTLDIEKERKRDGWHRIGIGLLSEHYVYG